MAPALRPAPLSYPLVREDFEPLVTAADHGFLAVVEYLHGLGCEWFAPRADPKPPLPPPPEPPFAPMMTSMSPPMGRLRLGRSSFSYETANQRLNHGVDDC